MSEPQVSVILPARDEEANIEAAVDSLAAQTAPVEIIVVNDNSTDHTGAILTELAGRIPELRVVDAGPLPPGWTGKAHALARGAERARAPWLLFTDADVRHQPRAVQAGLEAAHATGAALISCSPDQVFPTWWERAITPFVYCRLAERYPYECVSDPGDPLAAANGQWLLVSRKALDAVGGLAAVKGQVLEDVALAELLKRARYGLHFTRGVGLARTRMYARFPELWQGWSKNLFCLFGRRKSAVAEALARALLSLVAWILLPAGLWGIAVGSSLGWLAVLGSAILLWQRLSYAVALHRNSYPLGCVVYYTLGNVFFAALLLNSAWAHLRGKPVAWKGRTYAVAEK